VIPHGFMRNPGKFVGMGKIENERKKSPLNRRLPRPRSLPTFDLYSFHPLKLLTPADIKGNAN
ncbi:hypothetical protein WN55_10683, partial [Dufourea novaeangliae]